MQLENARLIGRLQSTQADLEQTVRAYDRDKERLKTLSKDIEELEKHQEERFKLMKKSLEAESEESRAKEAEDFKKIQDSQDDLISELQELTSQQALQIEHLTIDKTTLTARINLLEATAKRLEGELTVREDQIKDAEGKFESFRSQVQEDSSDALVTLKNSQQ